MTAPHGTSARYQQHRKEGEPACEPCRVAAADYCRDWRRKTGDPNGHASTKARHRALEQLKVAHPDEFEALYLDELRGVDRERGVA